MAITKMNQFRLFAFEQDRENLLKELQKFKFVHFEPLDREDNKELQELNAIEAPESIIAISEELSKIKWAIDFLTPYKETAGGLKGLQQGLDNYSLEELNEKAAKIEYKEVYEKLRNISTSIDEIKQEIQAIETKKYELTPWIELKDPLKSLYDFQKVKVMTGTIPKKFMEKFQAEIVGLEKTHVEFITLREGLYYILVISGTEEKNKIADILRNNSFSQINISGQDTVENEIKKLDESLLAMKAQEQKLEEEIKTFLPVLSSLELKYESIKNDKLRLTASNNFLKTDSVDIINGYLPTDKVQAFQAVLDKTLKGVYHLETKPAEKDDLRTPILLKNNAFAEAFDSITSMYALPKYNEIDPTPFLAVFYWVFFGMMAADIGYGLILLIGTAFALAKFNLPPGTRKFVKFFFYLSFSVIIWGAVYGSFFGDLIKLPALINPAEEYFTVMILSIIIGVIHLFFSLGLQAYMKIRDGRPLDALFDVGFWYLALGGVIVFLVAMVMPTLVPSIVGTIGKWVMIIGMAGIILTGGRTSGSIVGKLVGGVYSLYGISSYVGDFVSYTRLMALGLSGGFIAVAINLIVKMVSGGGGIMAIIGFIFGAVIFLGVHLFNIFLSCLGSYVHSARLTYVESFGKFYEGGGKPFKMFFEKPKYINIK